jgi:hypothetical protein
MVSDLRDGVLDTRTLATVATSRTFRGEYGATFVEGMMAIAGDIWAQRIPQRWHGDRR